MRREYDSAVAAAPDLVEKESQIVDFLRVESNNAQASATRLARYWKARKKCFGDRWLLPMNQTGSGDLSQKDLSVLRSGYMIVMPRPSGGVIALFDESKLVGLPADAQDSKMRIIFYFSSLYRQYSRMGKTIVHVVTSAERPAPLDLQSEEWRMRQSAMPGSGRVKPQIFVAQAFEQGKQELVDFLSANVTAKAMADAFISGVDSDRQTAGVRSTLANAFKKISTQKIFMVLSADEMPLGINHTDTPSIISVVNNPKKETSLSPVIATIIHSITKQMSERNRLSSFLLMEEAATLRLLNMHRIPATLRSYDIMTIYVLQDKIQNDMMYGDKASKAILSNLSYQFFGKANDPDTAKYYERFFEIVKKETRSISKGHSLNFDTRVTQGEKEVAKRRADAFYGLKQGEFVVFFDGKDKKVRFKMPFIERKLPEPIEITGQELKTNFDKIHQEAQSIFDS